MVHPAPYHIGDLSCTLFALLLLLLTANVIAGERLALVIGNAGYRHLNPLPNPPNDASAVAANLAAMGVILIGGDGQPTTRPVLDLDKAALSKAVNAFAQRAQGAEIALLFYAGHGMQIAGQPYLLPVDVPNDLDQLPHRSLRLEDDILVRLDGKADLTVAIFDACRAIPELNAAASRASGYDPKDYQGLARVQSQGRSRIVAYAGAAGQFVPDGNGQHSPYSTLLLEHLVQPQPVETLLQRVAAELSQRLGGQSPEILIQGAVQPGRFYLTLPIGRATPPATPALGYIQVINVTTTDEVWLDGQVAGHAGPGQPLDLSNLPVGLHWIMIRAKGKPLVEQVRVEAGRWAQVTLSPPLDPEEAYARADAERQQRIAQEAERLAAEEERRLAEEVARRSAEKHQRDREENLLSVLATEQLSRKAHLYIPEIRDRIRQFWVRPPATDKDLVATVSVQLIPGGDVVPNSVRVLKSSGNTSFDKSVMAAVINASPLPVPVGSSFENFRDFNMTFSPQ
ncbi:cell envelope integrity protein TolA [uncultured Thiocystis sp.]|uniref:cell envelope integrity protein TolA n=1 Tax=uncultured Thiocystis sp. TaxID=1202134 RepID=UPI0025D85753|nr:cell envelope integrity protein TolA [uncultured Thiocystis sp.]